METIIMLVVVVAALYFLMIRPQQRRAKQQREHMASLEPGARVMTVHGIFGTIVYLGEKQAVIEVSPGVELTVLKAAISNQPVTDEFEYDDQDAIDAPDDVKQIEPAVVAPLAAAAIATAAVEPAETAAATQVEPEPEPEPESVSSDDEPEAEAAESAQAETAASVEPFPDVSDDASFASWWDEHFPKN